VTGGAEDGVGAGALERADEPPANMFGALGVDTGVGSAAGLGRAKKHGVNPQAYRRGSANGLAAGLVALMKLGTVEGEAAGAGVDDDAGGSVGEGAGGLDGSAAFGKEKTVAADAAAQGHRVQTWSWAQPQAFSRAWVVPRAASAPESQNASWNRLRLEVLLLPLGERTVRGARAAHAGAR
jgi:hypothetical protein